MKSKTITILIFIFFLILPLACFIVSHFLLYDLYQLCNFYMPWKTYIIELIELLYFLYACVYIVAAIRLLLKCKKSISEMIKVEIFGYFFNFIISIIIYNIFLIDDIKIIIYSIISIVIASYIRLIPLSKIEIENNEFRTKKNPSYNHEEYQHNKESYHRYNSHDNFKKDYYSNIYSEQDEINKAFRIFEMNKDAAFEEIKKKRNILIKIFHPDKYANYKDMQKYAEEKTKEINEAFDILKKFYESRSKTV